MNSLEETVQQDTERLSRSALVGRELAELVDEWSVTPNGPRAREIASEMILDIEIRASSSHVHFWRFK